MSQNNSNTDDNDDEVDIEWLPLEPVPEDSDLPDWASSEDFVERLNETIAKIVSELEDPLNDCWEWPNGGKYPQLSHDGERIFLHRAVLTLVRGEPIPDDHEVHHICHNSNCIFFKHLEIKTPSEHSRAHINTEDDSRSVLSPEDVRKIKKLLLHTDHSYKEIGDRHGVGPRAICHIAQGDTWSHIDVPNPPGDVNLDQFFDTKGEEYAKLDVQDIQGILMLLSHTEWTQTEIANLHNIDRSSISRIKTGDSWKNVDVPHPPPTVPWWLEARVSDSE